jgi:hypothetical protein
MKAFNSLGLPVLRFNFRGAGLSHGEHDQGAGEIDDVRTALEWLDREFHQPIVFAGFSFGAAIGLRAAAPDPRVPVLISLGTPISPVDNRSYDYEFLTSSTKPKLFVSGSRDQFASKAKLEALMQSLAEPKSLWSSRLPTIFLKAVCARCGRRLRTGRRRRCIFSSAGT